MQHSSAIQLSGMIFISTFAVNLPLWILAAVKSYRSKKFIYTCPFVPVTVWIMLTIAGIGAQSISNIIEIPVINLTTLLTCSTLLFHKQFYVWAGRQKAILITVFVIFTLFMRLFTPIITE